MERRSAEERIAQTAEARLRIGTSGWAGTGWRKQFYPPSVPEAEWLSHYARHFTMVELTATCYRLPEEETVLRWRKAVPDSFRFAVRAPHRICRRKRLRNCAKDVQAFIERIALLDDRLGPVIWQLPPTFKRDEEALAAFLPLLPREMTHVFEFRHASWHSAGVRALLNAHDCALAFHDHDGRRAPWWETGPVFFFRLNGMQAQRRCYGLVGLKDFVAEIERALDDAGREVFVCFGDDAEGCAVRDASLLQHLFGQRPALPEAIATAAEEKTPIAITFGEDF